MFCSVEGNADMFGIGIRVGFYLQWFAVMLGSWIAPKEVPSLRFTNILFATATLVATIIQIIEHRLETVEVYIILMLNFGTAAFLIPILIWRIATGFNPRLDPTRFPNPRPSALFSFFQSSLLVTVGGFQLWFWSSRIRDLDQNECMYSGFIYERVGLQKRWFRLFNLAWVSLFLALLSITVFASIAFENHIKAIAQDDWDNM